MGLHRAGAGHRRAHRLLRTQQGRLQVDRDPRRQDRSAPRCSATAARSRSCSRRSTAGCRCRRSGSSCCSTSAARRRRSASPSWPTTPRSATATASARATSAARVEGGCKTVAGGDGQDPGRQGLRLLQGAGRPDRRVRRRRRGRGGPGRALLRAGHPDGQAGADGARSASADLRSLSAVFAALAPGGRRGRQVQDGPRLAAEDDVGRGVRRREGRPVHQRPGARQHPEGRHLLGRPADARRGHHPGAAAPDRRRRREVRRADGEADRRPADRPARHQEGGPARRSGPTSDMPSGYAYGKSLPHREDLRRPGVLPVRHRRLDQARDRDRDPDAGHGDRRPR